MDNIGHFNTIEFMKREYPKTDLSTKIENITHPVITNVVKRPVLKSSMFEDYEQMTPLQKLKLHNAQIKYYDEVKENYFDISIEEKKKRIYKIMDEI